eukprot:764632-Hanusia_phi.AAC.1
MSFIVFLISPSHNTTLSPPPPLKSINPHIARAISKCMFLLLLPVPYLCPSPAPLHLPGNYLVSSLLSILPPPPSSLPTAAAAAALHAFLIYPTHVFMVAAATPRYPLPLHAWVFTYPHPHHACARGPRLSPGPGRANTESQAGARARGAGGPAAPGRRAGLPACLPSALGGSRITRSGAGAAPFTVIPGRVTRLAT